MVRWPAHGSRIQQIPSRAANQIGATPQPDCRGTVTEDGFTFLDRLSFDPYNEGEDLKAQVFAYRRRHGHYQAAFSPIKFIGYAVIVRSVHVIRSG